MPAPTPNWNLVTVRWRVVRLDGTNPTGTLELRPVPSRFKDLGVNPPIDILTSALTGDIVDGAATVQVPASDDPDVFPNDFTYRVTEKVNGFPDNTYFIEVPLASAGTGIDLASISPVDPVSGAGSVVVTLAAFNALIARVAELEENSGTGGGGTGLPPGGTTAHILQGDGAWVLKSALLQGLASTDHTHDYASPDHTHNYATPGHTHSGYASTAHTHGDKADLGVDGKILASQLPAVAISNTFPVASQAAMLALTAEPGDVAVRSDPVSSGGGRTYILMAEPASTLANWVEMPSIGQVVSVFGRVGAVTAAISDIAQLATELGARLRTIDSGTPSNAVGSDGNWLLRMSDGVFFKKVTGAWVQQAITIGSGGGGKPILREAFAQDGDAIATIVGQESISNYARKLLPVWMVSNDNILSATRDTTVRLFYRDAANAEVEIAQNLTIPAGSRSAVVTLSGTLPTVPAQRLFYAKATVAPASTAGELTYPGYTVGTFVNSADAPANNIQVPVPAGKVGKIAVIGIGSTTGAGALPNPPAGTPQWNVIKSRSDAAGSLWGVIAWKPIQAGETVYPVSFAGNYAAVGGVVVLDTFDPTLLDPDYEVQATADTFQKNPGTTIADSTTADTERVLRFVFTRTSSAEFNSLSVTGETKIGETTTARPTAANVHMAVTTQTKATAGLVAEPTMTSPHNSRWLVNAFALAAYAEELIGASNLTVHGEVEVQV